MNNNANNVIKRILFGVFLVFMPLWIITITAGGYLNATGTNTTKLNELSIKQERIEYIKNSFKAVEPEFAVRVAKDKTIEFDNHVVRQCLMDESDPKVHYYINVISGKGFINILYVSKQTKLDNGWTLVLNEGVQLGLIEPVYYYYDSCWKAKGRKMKKVKPVRVWDEVISHFFGRKI